MELFIFIVRRIGHFGSKVKIAQPMTFGSNMNLPERKWSIKQRLVPRITGSRKWNQYRGQNLNAAWETGPSSASASRAEAAESGGDMCRMRTGSDPSAEWGSNAVCHMGIYSLQPSSFSGVWPPVTFPYVCPLVTAEEHALANGSPGGVGGRN